MAEARCPVCHSPAVVGLAHEERLQGYITGEHVTAGHCPACGWCHHTGRYPNPGACDRCGRPDLRPDAWRAPEHLPRPAGMDREEFAFRAALYLKWKLGTPGEYATAVLVFADWLADRNSPEEHAARADWRPRGNRAGNCLGWWQWEGLSGPGWADPNYTPVGLLLWDHRPEHRAARRAGLTGWPSGTPQHTHAGGWFLGWPPGFARVTRADGWTHDDTGYRTRWVVTVQPGRALGRSMPRDYVPLFAPYAGDI